jgi:hypothetical protein
VQKPTVAATPRPRGRLRARNGRSRSGSRGRARVARSARSALGPPARRWSTLAPSRSSRSEPCSRRAPRFGSTLSREVYSSRSEGSFRNGCPSMAPSVGVWLPLPVGRQPRRGRLSRGRREQTGHAQQVVRLAILLVWLGLDFRLVILASLVPSVLSVSRPAPTDFQTAGTISSLACADSICSYRACTTCN